MRIIKAGPEHLALVTKMVQATIREIYPKYYPSGAVASYLAHHCEENIAKDMTAGRVYLLGEQESYVATGTLQENYIGRLYVPVAYQNQGYGSKLLTGLEHLAFDAGHLTVQLDASLNAYHMYLHRGYRPLTYEIMAAEEGHFLCYYKMEKSRPSLG